MRLLHFLPAEPLFPCFAHLWLKGSRPFGLEYLMIESTSHPQRWRQEKQADRDRAFDRIYRAFFVRLVHHAMRRFRISEEDCRDVVQDAFLVALAKVDTERNLTCWLFRTVDNLGSNWKRKVARRARLTAEWAPSIGSPQHEEDDS
jgi:DNA-directed RNA polymerase specialized sigma24 family protein